jgi:hypothetical protein
MVVLEAEVVDLVIATTKTQAQAQDPVTLIGYIQYSRN